MVAGNKLRDKAFSNENAENVPTKEAKAKPFSNENTRKTPEPQLKRGGKRSGASFDTGTIDGKNLRFQAVKTAVLAQKCPPSVRQVMKRFSARYEVARDFLAELARQGVVVRERSTGVYTLIKKS